MATLIFERFSNGAVRVTNNGRAKFVTGKSVLIDEVNGQVIIQDYGTVDFRLTDTITIIANTVPITTPGTIAAIAEVIANQIFFKSSGVTVDTVLASGSANAISNNAVFNGLAIKENTANKDATGGYAGLTLFKINFKNALNTFTSFFTNSNTAARTYTFQDRDGTIADNTDLALKANLASPAFTGAPSLPTGATAITQTANNNTTALSTTAYVDAADALKANLASPAFTGTPSLPTGATGITQAVDDNTTKLSTTAYVVGQGYAKLASPAFSGTPSLPTGATAVTQSAADNTTKIATTAFATTADNLKANLAAPAFTTSIQAPIVILPSQAAPGSTAGATTIFSEDVAGMDRAGQVAPNQTNYHFQPSLQDVRVAAISYQANTSSATGSNLGLQAAAVTGTVSAVAVATTNYFTAISRAKFSTAAATAGSSVALLGNGAKWRLSSTANAGGFSATFNFGISHAATVANARCFIGFEPTQAAIGNVEPSSLINIIGVGCDAGGTTLKVFTNDGIGTATIIDLGVNFPISTLSTDWYKVTFNADPGNAALITYRVERRNTTDVATGTITTDLPANNQLLNWQVWANNGVTALTAAFDFSTLTIETRD